MKLRHFLFCVFITISFSSNSQNKISIELSSGKFITNYTSLKESVRYIFGYGYLIPKRYFQLYSGKENINISVHYSVNNRFNISMDINYARMFYDVTNTKGVFLSPTINANYIFAKIKKFDFRLGLGVGFEQIHTKSLDNFYPYTNTFYGIPLKSKFSFMYNLNEKIGFFIDSDLTYGFLFYNPHLNNSSYYKTCFSSCNIGFRCTFIKQPNSK